MFINIKFEFYNFFKEFNKQIQYTDGLKNLKKLYLTIYKILWEKWKQAGK